MGLSLRWPQNRWLLERRDRRRLFLKLLVKVLEYPLSDYFPNVKSCFGLGLRLRFTRGLAAVANKQAAHATLLKTHRAWILIAAHYVTVGEPRKPS